MKNAQRIILVCLVAQIGLALFNAALAVVWGKWLNAWVVPFNAGCAYLNLYQYRASRFGEVGRVRSIA